MNNKELDEKDSIMTQEMELNLMKAAFHGNLDCVRNLIDGGVNISAVDGNLDSAIHLACLSGHRDVVQYLLRQGASPNEANAYGFTPLTLAVGRKDENMVKLLLQYLDFKGCKQTIKQREVKEKDHNHTCITDYGYQDKEELEPALICAVRDENKAIVKMLLDANIPVDESGQGGLTALHYAVYENENPEILKLLISAKPNINVTDRRGKTPLVIACEEQKEDFILILLQHGANADFTPRRGWGVSALNKAVEFASKDVVQALCEASSDVSKINTERPILNRYSSLRIAIQFKNIEAVRTLIRYGCKLDTTEKVQYFGHMTLLEYTLPARNRHQAMDIKMFKLLNAARAFTNKQLYSCYCDENLRTKCAEEMFCALGESVSNPAKLTYLCRKAVRDVIRTPLPKTVPKLGLPQIIREFLLYSDI